MNGSLKQGNIFYSSIKLFFKNNNKFAFSFSSLSINSQADIRPEDNSKHPD